MEPPPHSSSSRFESNNKKTSAESSYNFKQRILLFLDSDDGAEPLRFAKLYLTQVEATFMVLCHVDSLFEEGGDWERKNGLKVYEGLYC